MASVDGPVSDAALRGRRFELNEDKFIFSTAYFLIFRKPGGKYGKLQDVSDAIAHPIVKISGSLLCVSTRIGDAFFVDKWNCDWLWVAEEFDVLG